MDIAGLDHHQQWLEALAEMVVDDDLGHHQRVALERKPAVADDYRVDVPAGVVGQRHQKYLLALQVGIGRHAVNAAQTGTWLLPTIARGDGYKQQCHNREAHDFPHRLLHLITHRLFFFTHYSS